MFPIFVLARRSNPIQLIFLSTTKNSSNVSLLHLLRFLHHKSPSQQQKQPIEKNHSSSSFTISYLINSCGLSPHSALSASKKFNIKSTENPDSVLNLLKSYGFADAQIAKLVLKFPMLLSYNPENTVRPKIDFFLGYSGARRLPELIISCPDLLKSSLEKRIIPNFGLLRPVFDTDQQLLTAARRNTRLLTHGLDTNFLPNVKMLRGFGIPNRNIAKLVTFCPRIVMGPTEPFKAIIESIMKMGFNPLSMLFVHGIHAKSGLSPSSWEHKVSLYKSLGWSEAEFISAFTISPFCMKRSEEKIRQRMEFFVNKMHWTPSFLSKRPVLLTLNLGKRVIPRCSVLNVLASKGLVKRNSSVQYLCISEKNFIDKYVFKYQDQVPEVLQAYNGNVEFVGLEGGTGD